MWPSIQNLRAFVAVTRSGRFAEAARELGVTESAVSHQIARLEAQLGVRLLERGRERARPTEQGKRLLGHIETALREIELGVRAARTSPGRIVSLTAPRTLAALWLAPNLAGLYAAHPEIEINIVATDRLCDLEREGIDFAIRRGSDPWRGCEQQPFCAEEIAPVAAHDLAEAVLRDGWQRVRDTAVFIRNETHPQEWTAWSAATGLAPPRPDTIRSLGTYDQVQAAAINGLGIALARTPLCLEALGDGRLHRVGPAHQAESTPYRIVWRQDMRWRGQHRQVLDWLVANRPGGLAEA